MIRVDLFASNDERPLGQAVYAAMPTIGTEVIIIGSWEPERWLVQNVIQWPHSDALPDDPPSIWVFVKYLGDVGEHPAAKHQKAQAE